MEYQKLEKDPIKQIGLNRHGEEAEGEEKKAAPAKESEKTNLNTSGLQEGPRVDPDAREILH